MKYESMRRILKDHVDVLEDKKERLKEWKMEKEELACLECYKYILKMMNIDDGKEVELGKLPHENRFIYR
jgi:hypothetical protein